MPRGRDPISGWNVLQFYARTRLRAKDETFLFSRKNFTSSFEITTKKDEEEEKEIYQREKKIRYKKPETAEKR